MKSKNTDKQFIVIPTPNTSMTREDADAIAEMVRRHILDTSEQQQPRAYRIKLTNGKKYTGTPADVARWYCKQKNIKLFIEPESTAQDASLALLAQVGNGHTCTHIAYVDGQDNDFESGYRLFFKEYLSEPDEEDDYTISPCA